MTSLITTARLFALCPKARQDIIAKLAPALEINRVEFDVSSPLRVAHAMAQFAVESAGFTRLEEHLDYTHADRIAAVWPKLAARAASLVEQPQALANAAYANELGNGDEASGDGWRYRGRGIVQLTGRANYAVVPAHVAGDLVDNPGEACVPAAAARIALWFFWSRGCNRMADSDDADAITRAINGPAMEQASIRRALAVRAKAIFV